MICERERGGGKRGVREVRVSKRCVCVRACVLCESIGARRGDFVLVVFKICDTYEAYLGFSSMSFRKVFLFFSFSIGIYIFLLSATSTWYYELYDIFIHIEHRKHCSKYIIIIKFNLKLIYTIIRYKRGALYYIKKKSNITSCTIFTSNIYIYIYILGFH